MPRQSSRMAAQVRVYWKAYTLMILALISGIAVAVGHHVFYSKLAGKTVVSGNTLMIGVTMQQANLAIGTALSVLVHILLGSAVTTAYTQVVWKTIKRRKRTLLTIDTIYSALDNPLSIFSVTVWWRHRLLLLLAIHYWSLSVVSVIAPATLTVEIAAADPAPSIMTRVPNVDFLSLNFANLPEYTGGASAAWFYAGPQYAVSKIVSATAFGGNILPINAPAPNSSWTLEFPGPSLTCVNVEDQVIEAVVQNMKNLPWQISCNLAGYIAWTPDDSGFVPWAEPSDSTNSFRSDTLGLGNFTCDNTTISTATFFVATFPEMANELQSSENCYNQGNQYADAQYENLSIVQCGLFNATYQANFNFVNGAQDIDITTQDQNVLNGVVPVVYLNSSAAGPLNSLAPNGTPLPNVFNLTEVRTLAYQAVMDAFGVILIGTISDIFSRGGSLQATTNVMSTILSNTVELQSISKRSSTKLTNTLQQTIAQSNGSAFNGLSVVNSDSYSLHLAQALEELFRNITISLMSSPLLQPNVSSPYALPLTNVTLPRYQNTYYYDKDKLWLVYSIMILFSVFAVIVGLASMKSEGISYSSNFSTILRVAKGADVSVVIDAADTDGGDPLPSYLAELVYPLLGMLRARNCSGVLETRYAEDGREEERHGNGQKFVAILDQPNVAGSRN